MNEQDARIEYFESLHKSNAIIELMRKGANMILEGGTDGIQTVASEQPEIIITAVQSLVSLVVQQQEERVAFAEQHFDYVDRTQSLLSFIENLK